jgi:hypothetical protein
MKDIKGRIVVRTEPAARGKADVKRRIAVRCVNIWMVLVVLPFVLWFFSIETGSLFRPAPWIEWLNYSIYTLLGAFALVIVVVVVQWTRTSTDTKSPNDRIKPRTLWQLILTCVLVCVASTYSAHVYVQLTDAVARVWPGVVFTLPGEVISASSFGSEFDMNASVANFGSHNFTITIIVGVPWTRHDTRYLAFSKDWLTGGGGPASFTLKENIFGTSLLWVQKP